MVNKEMTRAQIKALIREELKLYGKLSKHMLELSVKLSRKSRNPNGTLRDNIFTAKQKQQIYRLARKNQDQLTEFLTNLYLLF